MGYKYSKCSTITFFPDETIGRIWMKSSTTRPRDNLLTQGLNINGQYHKTICEQSFFLTLIVQYVRKKIFFKDLNFDVDENQILDYVNNNLLSNLI